MRNLSFVIGKVNRLHKVGGAEQNLPALEYMLCVQGIQADHCPVGHNISCVSREYSQTSVQLDTT